MITKLIEDFLKLKDYELLTILLYGEGRGEPIEGRIGIANVVRNRVNAKTWFGKSWHDVMLKPFQFSCFNENDPNFLKCLELARDPILMDKWKEEKWIALGIIEDNLKDNTKGATHYHANYVHPQWTLEMKKTIELGRHIFYKVK